MHTSQKKKMMKKIVARFGQTTRLIAAPNMAITSCNLGSL